MDAQKPDKPLEAFIDIKPGPPGFWIRFCAFIIDFVCIWLPCIWLAFALEEHLISKHMAARHSGISFFVVLFCTFFYQALTIGRRGQTLGKFLAGILTVRRNGGNLGYLRSFGRTSVWYLVAFLLFLGVTFNISTCGAGSPFIVVMLGFMCLVGTILQDKIFFYDWICGTKVVYKRPIGSLRKTAVAIFGMVVLLTISYEIGRGHVIPEKARVAEAMSVISSIKSSQERYLALHKVYADKFTELDISCHEITAGRISTKFYMLSISTSACGRQPCYVVTATRHVNNARVAARYGLYSLNAIIPGLPRAQVAGCPGGYGNCAELIY